MLKKVEEKEQIIEISENSKKIEFAKLGLNIHKINDICAFCGNNVSENRYLKLERYFSTSEVKKIELEINDYITFLENEITKINDFSIDEKNFYPEYIEEIFKIKDSIENKKNNND